MSYSINKRLVPSFEPFILLIDITRGFLQNKFSYSDRKTSQSPLFDLALKCLIYDLIFHVKIDPNPKWENQNSKPKNDSKSRAYNFKPIREIKRLKFYSNVVIERHAGKKGALA